MLEKIIRRLKKSKRVFLATHVDPDGDAIGSLIALGLALDSLGKDALCYNESPIPAVYRFLNGVNRIKGRIHGPARGFDAAVILDCGALERIGNGAQWLNGLPIVINVDHHETNTGFGDVALVDTGACATAEIIYRLIKSLGVDFNADIATAIYTGILTDTGSFRFSNTNQAAFKICEEMIGYGTDPYTVSQHVYGHFSMGRLKLLNLALNSIEISDNGRLSIMSLTQEMMKATGTQSEDVDGFINYARRIQDVRVAVLIQEKNNGRRKTKTVTPYHVSLRSDGSVDVASIATAFGGGGHSSAAGFNVESTLAELKSRILNLARVI